MPNAAFHTLGCKVNQYETQKMAEALSAEGFDIVDFSDQADVYVINSCTVTQTADSKSRQAVRGAVRRNPKALVVLTGCFAETSVDEARAIEGVSLVVGNRDKQEIAKHILSRLPAEKHIGRLSARHISAPKGRTRALLKIQDGCDQHCSYCAVPVARPEMWSKPFQEAVDEAAMLVGQGYREIVLTGIRLGRYQDKGNLAGLLDRLADIHGIERIRMSSLEFTDAPDGLLEVMAAREKVCRHLHLPLQSGSDSVLKRMNRPYTAGEFRRFVEKARTLVPDIAVTTDIMVGYPGETGDEFTETFELAECVRFSRAHVFRYSPRPRTEAQRLRNDVPEQEKKRRSDLLIRHAARHSEEFARRFIGKTMPVLVEGEHNEAKLRDGLTDNYVRVAFESTSAAGELVNVLIDKVRDGRVLGIVR